VANFVGRVGLVDQIKRLPAIRSVSGGGEGSWVGAAGAIRLLSLLPQASPRFFDAGRWRRSTTR
jgi:hypothetical protein